MVAAFESEVDREEVEVLRAKYVGRSRVVHARVLYLRVDSNRRVGSAAAFEVVARAVEKKLAAPDSQVDITVGAGVGGGYR